jgi:hypothetical protein
MRPTRLEELILGMTSGQAPAILPREQADGPVVRTT